MGSHAINFKEGDWIVFQNSYYRIKKMVALEEDADLDKLVEDGTIEESTVGAFAAWESNRGGYAAIGFGGDE